jgi:hypothetical protein
LQGRWLSGQRSPNQPRHQTRNRRPAARLPLLRHLEALAKEHPIPWRSKRARSFPMPAVQNRLRQQCKAAANPWKLAPTARLIPNQSSSRKSESPAGCCSVDRTLHPRNRVGLVDHDHPPQNLRPAATHRPIATSASGQRRRFGDVPRYILALLPRADIHHGGGDVRFVPLPDSCVAANWIAIRSPRRRLRAAMARW